MTFRIIIVSSVFLAGCMTSATPMVRVQAATDFVCPESNVRVVHDAANTYDAYGCGKHRRYFARCEGSQCVVTHDARPTGPMQPRQRPEGDISPRRPLP